MTSNTCNLSITTDYCTSQGNPELPLRLIAQAGFTHLHWSHHFSDDFIYCDDDIQAIRGMMSRYHLQLLDVHGSTGNERCWCSLNEAQRQLGVELVLNRAKLFHVLEGQGHLIMHIPVVTTVDSEEKNAVQREQFKQVLRSIDELLPQLERLGIPLALENTPNDTWELLEDALRRYPEKQVGICYDSGHGNIGNNQLSLVERNQSRLVTLHLNDNDGVHDIHQPPFMGTVNWEKLAAIIANSVYSKPLSFEITMRVTPFRDEAFSSPEQPETNQLSYLKDSWQRCLKMDALVKAAKTR